MEKKINLEEVRTLLSELEAFRKKYSKRARIFLKIQKFYRWIFPVAMVVFVVSVIFPVLFAATWPLFVIAVILLIIDTYFHNALSKRSGTFYRRFKTEVMPLAIKSANPNLEYDPWKGISKQVFDQSLLIRDKAEFYSSEDLIKGRFGKVEFQCCEVSASKSIYSAGKIVGSIAKGCLGFFVWIIQIFHDGDANVDIGDDDINLKKRVKLFNGLFLWADFHKSFSGSVILRSKREGVTSFQKSKLEKTEIGDVEFDKRYDVYTTDFTLARYVLSPYLLQQLRILDELSPGPMNATFRDGHMYLGLPQNKDLFDCSFHKGVPDLDAFEKFVREVKIIENVLIHLDQNTRVWGDKAMKE